MEIADGLPMAQARLRRPRLKGSARANNPWLLVPALAFVAATFLLPVGVVAWYSLHPTAYGAISGPLTVQNFARVLASPVYGGTLLRSLGFVAIVAAVTVAVAFPFAYYVALRVRPARRNLLIVVATIPFFTSHLARVIAWLNLLGAEGVINKGLLALGLADGPLDVLSLGRPAIVVTFVYLLAPLAFLTLYAALERIDPNLLEAASDLGAPRHKTFLRVILPAARNGLVSSFAFVFIALFGDYITPVMIGGTDGVLFVNLMVNQFGASMQWGFGCAMAVVMLASTLVLLAVIKALVGRQRGSDGSRRHVEQPSPVLGLYTAGFLAFLYAPILLLLAFALNASERVGLPFTGITLHWFAEALGDRAFMEALWISLRVAFMSSLAGTALGACAAITLARSSGLTRNGTLALLAAPMLLPPAVLGIGMLMCTQALGLPRGLWTVVVGHTLLALPVATLVMLARLEGIRADQEFAAMDLGARPSQALRRITLPQAVPALMAALLITFALSMDEFILTFLVTATDTTLPLFIYGSIRFRMTPAVIAGASLILIVSIALIILGSLALFMRDMRAGRRREAAHASRA